jgi:hypothetical protein
MATFPLRRTHAALVGLALLTLAAVLPASAADAPPMPEFRQPVPAAWLNSPPLSREKLRGKVVLIDLFTTA